MLEAQQMMEVNGGDNVVEDTVEAKPTCKEALMATFTLQKYITDINEPFAHKLEGILASFGHQTRLEDVHMMETTYITGGGQCPVMVTSCDTMCDMCHTPKTLTCHNCSLHNILWDIIKV